MYGSCRNQPKTKNYSLTGGGDRNKRAVFEMSGGDQSLLWGRYVSILNYISIKLIRLIMILEDVHGFNKDPWWLYQLDHVKYIYVWSVNSS